MKNHTSWASVARSNSMYLLVFVTDQFCIQTRILFYPRAWRSSRMTENAQFWFNQELIAPPPMACAGHKTRTKSDSGRPFTLHTMFTVNTLLEKMYHTMCAAGKVIKYNLKNTKKKYNIFH